jgi:hypothetical protein
MNWPVRVAALIGLVLIIPAPAVAKKPWPLYSDQIRGQYAEPKDPKHQAIQTTLRERRVLERLRELLSPLRLPRILTLKTESCDGVANAFYEDDAVTICYEYLDFIMQSVPKQTTAGGLTPSDALVGPTVDVFLHEVGHAVFDMLEIPVFGREEDAADMFSAYILLRFAPADAQRLIRGVAFLGAREAKEAQQQAPDIKAFADSHGLPAQRYFNVLCMAYGFDEKHYADAITRGGLPAERAEGCADEYAMVDRAFKKLVMPYVDQRRLRRVRANVRFGFGDAKPTAIAPPGAPARP